MFDRTVSAGIRLRSDASFIVLAVYDMPFAKRVSMLILNGCMDSNWHIFSALEGCHEGQPPS